MTALTEEKKAAQREYSRAWVARNPEKAAAQSRRRSRAYYSRNRVAVRQRVLTKEYGITAEQWHAMLIAQSGLCAICTRPFIKTPQVDHCHVTGKVRGLLCSNCNTGLSKLGDTVASLSVALNYLEDNS